MVSIRQNLVDMAAKAFDNPIRAEVERARRAQSGWRGMTLSARTRALKRAAKTMLADRESIVALVAKEVGKIRSEAIFTEALGPLDAVSGWATLIEEESRRKVSLNPLSFPKKRAEIWMEPRGVIGIISPWNFPVAGLYRSVIPALLLGNSVVVKPSEYCPESSAWFLDHLARELPVDVLRVVQGAGDVGANLIDAGIDACVFTGSVQTGAKVRKRCAAAGVPLSAELGGNDAAIVLADCDLQRTVAGITQWSLQNAGQACGAIEIVYVVEDVADAFVAELTRAFSNVDTTSDDVHARDMSAVSNLAQVEQIEAHIEDALQHGATLLTGGKRGDTKLGPGAFFPATLLDGCTADMRVVNEETFGPVLAVVRVSAVDAALRAVNAGVFGLGASLWTKDVRRATRLASRLNVGTVTINNHAFTGALSSVPWSGRKSSGSGIANGAFSLLNFAQLKTVATDSNDGPDPFWLPLGHDLAELGSALADVQIGKKLWRAAKLPLQLNARLSKIKRAFKM